ncbi:PREDICTED: LOW QUALITY PROTEIN: N-acetylglucosamine-1-phosphodiester alpha-N-acetylglucosaminidase [Elephantulus edwardii]|uniref:LOW QUALITY PROTEIN: N-acetylglucosamine-1-phosphodiester alpha-N-acetylglucosaminidase n=1 Tax=Elephantulus edwardii TaxID=28737 RepID=UPI0003F070D4|nr:PREDICTED: LOW QUALITY PROTEIN: N-acetylglucosamine-1-phosphodiester alpha-N-acetylglucosaminidase [Elephantulus edwardii]
MAASTGRWPLLFLVLLGAHGNTHADLGSGVSRDDDLLLPYSRARVRSPRDCAPVRTGIREHETWPPARATPNAGTVSVRTFVSYFAGRAVAGHLTRATAPLRTFSVLEPGGPGGCKARQRATVEETARTAACQVAQNGGFFRMETGECLGSVVSDGRLVSSSQGLQNAQFGIRRDGTLVTGYLSEEEVLNTENPFVQLVSGVVWLIRNGSTYINESLATECDQTQETGSFSKFVNVISARTAIGHDWEGKVVLFHADGQTEQRGISLWEMAEFLLQQGVVNAINLDGGGSATFVLNGTLANFPSDHCEDNMWRCPRRVSTVVCVHEPRCQPPDCSGHGTCVQGSCQCTGHFWRGEACNELDCGPSNCSGHGLCIESGCSCKAGWTGSNCSEACTNGSFGQDCAQKCQCQNGAACDPVHGTCTCPPGFTGDLCAQECPLGWYGPGCQSPCQCEHSCPCDPYTGNCSFSWSPATSSLLSLAKQCFPSFKATTRASEPSFFTGTTWLVLTLTLLFLLVVSMAVNVTLFRGSRVQRNRHLDGDYAYHPLQETNGAAPATEKQLGDACCPRTDRTLRLTGLDALRTMPMYPGGCRGHFTAIGKGKSQWPQGLSRVLSLPAWRHKPQQPRAPPGDATSCLRGPPSGCCSLLEKGPTVPYSNYGQVVDHSQHP